MRTPKMLVAAAVGGALLLLTPAQAWAAGGGGHAPLAGAPDQAAADVVHVARNQLGDPYAWGATGPGSWDCSGLTGLWRSVGGARGTPRTSRDQQAWAVPIPRAQLLRGDLVFFGAPVSHVGLYLGRDRMIDASETAGRVVERAVWTSGVVRYGRAPRLGMPRVRPWTPPPPPVADSSRSAPAPAASGRPPAAKPRLKPKPKPAKPKPAKPKPAKPAPARPATGLEPLRGLPTAQRSPSSATALRMVAGARTVVGSPAWTDVSLIQTAWRHAGGKALPGERAALVARGRPVPLADARAGDLVVYGTSATHLGIYLGHGRMVDASPRAGRVLDRPVYASGFSRLVRLG